MIHLCFPFFFEKNGKGKNLKTLYENEERGIVLDSEEKQIKCK